MVISGSLLGDGENTEENKTCILGKLVYRAERNHEIHGREGKNNMCTDNYISYEQFG